MLTTAAGKSKQDALAYSDVQGYISAGQNLGISNAGVLVYYAELYNRGMGVARRILNAAANGGAYSSVTLSKLHSTALANSSSYYTSRLNNAYNTIVSLGWGDAAATPGGDNGSSGADTSDFSESYAGTYTVTASSLNVRSTPSTSGAKVGTLPSGAKDITICGRGILDGSDWEHNAGPTDYMINAKHCNNLVMKDIILKGSYYWTIVPQDCDRVLIDHIRLAGSRVGNDDGVDPCNSSNVTIRNCFFRTDDDSVSPKGITRAGGESHSKSVENITVENCVFWVDFANVFRMATESSCPAFRNFTARNIDVIHFPDRDRVQIFWLHPTGEMSMENLCFENIRINGHKPYNLIKMTPALQLVGTRPIEKPRPNNIKTGPGRRGPGSCGYGEFVVVPSSGPYIHNVTFRNIYTYGTKNSPKAGGTVLLQGIDDKYNISGVTFENVSYYGEPINALSEKVQMNDFVKHVQFVGKHIE